MVCLCCEMTSRDCVGWHHLHPPVARPVVVTVEHDSARDVTSSLKPLTSLQRTDLSESAQQGKGGYTGTGYVKGSYKTWRIKIIARNRNTRSLHHVLTSWDAIGGGCLLKHLNGKRKLQRFTIFVSKQRQNIITGKRCIGQR